MPAEILSGEVYEKDESGVWRLILTSWGVPVVDNRTTSRPGGFSAEGVSWKYGAPKATFYSDVTSFRMSDYLAYPQPNPFRMPYSGA